MAEFEERKLKVMAAIATEASDRSRKGGIDAPIANLISRINAHPDFFTTSSCSGRITLFSEPCPDSENKRKKKGGEWSLVSHEAVRCEDVVSAVNKFISNSQNELLVFRFEPFILALDCVSVAAAQEIVACAISSGFRESGISGVRKRIMVAVRCSIRLEVPVAEKEKLLVSDEYLKFLSLMANRKLEQNKLRTDKFLESFITQFQSGALSSLDSMIEVTHDEHFKVEDAEDVADCEDDSSSEKTEKSFSSCGRRSFSKWIDESPGLSLRTSVISGKSSERLLRWGHSACTIESGLLIFGGYGGTGRHSRLNDILLFGTHNQEIRCLEQKIGVPPRMSHTASVVNSKIWIVGGRKGPHNLLADVLIMDVAAEEGDLSISSPNISGAAFAPRHRHAAAVVKDKIYVFGGLGEVAVLGDLYVLDTVAKTWSQIECKGEAPSARYSHTFSAVGEKIYLFGGCDGKHIFGDLHEFDTEIGAWTRVVTAGDIPVPRFSHSCTVIGRCLAVLGGCPTLKQLNSLFLLDVSKLVWRRVSLGLPNDCLLVRHTASLVQDCLVVIGGGASCYAFGTMFNLSFFVNY